MDDSGFPRTPDRPVKLLGTRERYPRSVKTTIGARGPNFLGGSATPTVPPHARAACESHGGPDDPRALQPL